MVKADRRKIAFIIFGIIMIFVMLAFIFFTAHQHICTINDLSVTQNNLSLHASWKNEQAKSFKIRILKENSLVEEIVTDKRYVTFSPDSLGENYTFEVSANYPLAEYYTNIKTLKTNKLSQSVDMEKTTYSGFVGETIKIGGTAKTNLKYTPKTKNITHIKSGYTSLDSEGVAVIDVTALGNNFYNESSSTVKINIYPTRIEAPEIKSKIKDKKIILYWDKPKYAAEFTIFKYDPWSNKYKEIDKTEDIKYVVDNKNAVYKIKAKGTILDKPFESEYSNDISISTLSDLSSYSSATLVKNIERNDIQIITTLNGPQGTSCPQSFSLTEKGFIVAFANPLGTRSGIAEYNFNGKKLHEAHTESGFANGSVFNPDTAKVYTLRKHGDFITRTCDVFYRKDFSHAGSFDLPETVSGIGYDVFSEKYCLVSSSRIYITDSEFNVEKSFNKIVRRTYTQDCNIVNGIIIAASWEGGTRSYVDLYRESDGAYLGTYSLNFGEIESATIIDDKLIILVNNAFNDNQDIIAQTDLIIK